MKLAHSLLIASLLSDALAAPWREVEAGELASELVSRDLAPRDQEIINTFQVTGPNIELQSVSKVHMWQHTFANSYGTPKVAQYTPPNQDFDRVRLSYNSSVTTTQYDRLIHVFVGDTEVWRSSTAEPVGSPLVQFGFEKDVSEYVSLFKSPQTITFVLGNVVEDGLQGQFDTNFFIEFLQSGDSSSSSGQVGEALSWNYGAGGDHFKPADIVQGISKGNGDSYSFPDDSPKTNLKLPRNTTRAVVEIHASGNSNEEFWYTNMFTELSGSDGDGSGGPSRIVEVWIGGHLAGVAFPYPVVYTGGISPYFWTPIVSPQAFDGPGYRIDVTPFLPWLWQGIDLELKLTAQYKADTPQNAQQNWFVNGALLAWSEKDVEGSGGVYVAENTPTYAPLWNKLSNSDMVQVSHVNRVVKVMSKLQFKSPRGSLNAQVTWNQNGVSNNVQYYTSSSQAVLQSTKGQDSLDVVLNGVPQTVWKASYFYPMVLNTKQNGNVQNSDIITGYDRIKTGAAYERTLLNATSQMGGDSSWGNTYQSYWRSLANAYDLPANYDATYYTEEAKAEHGNLQFRNPSSSGSQSSFKDGSTLDVINGYSDATFANQKQDPWSVATSLSNVIKTLGFSPAEIPSSSNDKSFAVQSGGNDDSAGPYRIVFSGGNRLHQH
ncbi:Peptide-N4-(N-acetyl-beta-glucosaminyl)asparagine amidase A [Yarrowia sp. C11]|nr:Peptide-N4-(N-acetyl-beta-glucosaminyl)asparagine amidase A [Yarrowia sp. C11]KAG5370835.1 Peptide-N4-(N-acetyl-beta-glucosaminyl)asparagine amidase A [Yarrowia sp. E02]